MSISAGDRMILRQAEDALAHLSRTTKFANSDIQEYMVALTTLVIALSKSVLTMSDGCDTLDQRVAELEK